MAFTDSLLSPVNWFYFAVTAVLLVYWKWRGPKYNLPPGPKGWPIIGNILSLLGGHSMHLIFMDMAKKYGPIFTLYIGRRRTVIISNNKLALEAFVKKPHDISGRPYFPSGNWLSEGLKDIVFADPGRIWRLQRKIGANAFRNYISGEKLEERIHSCLNTMIDHIRCEKTAFDPYGYLTLCIYNFIAGFCWQGSYDLEDPEFKMISESLNAVNEGIGLGLPEDYIDLLKHIPNKHRRKAQKEWDKLLSFFYEKFRQQRTSFNPDAPRHLIDELLLAHLQEEQDDAYNLLTDTHLVQTISDIFTAGTDTTRQTIYWCFLYMAAYPDVQTKIQAEIDRVVGHHRLPCLKDRESLAYTDATMHEIMRIRPLLPLLLPHKCIKETTVGGYDIPQGSDVIVNIWALHHDPVYWNTADQFDPDRFMENGHLVPKCDSFMPFSAGRRVCLGEAVAKPELFIVFAGLLQNFCVEPETTVNLEPEPASQFGMPMCRRTNLYMKPRF